MTVVGKGAVTVVLLAERSTSTDLLGFFCRALHRTVLVD